MTTIARKETNLKTVVDLEEWITFDFWPINCAVMGFRVYEISSMSMDESEIFYGTKGATSSQDETSALDEAEMLMDGSIKFDGCMNLIFSGQNECMPHFCGNPADKFKFIFDQLYKFATELMPDHKEYLLK